MNLINLADSVPVGWYFFWCALVGFVAGFALCGFLVWRQIVGHPKNTARLVRGGTVLTVSPRSKE